MSKGKSVIPIVYALLLCLSLPDLSWADHINTTSLKSKCPKKMKESPRIRRRLTRSCSTTVAPVSASLHRSRYHERSYMRSFAKDIAARDITGGEDPVVRQAAIDALGNMNGTVVAIEPTSGRVLAMVNQKLALSSGAQPCSTIKLSVALAALNEGLVSKGTEVALGRRSRTNLTEALAHSNNAYFEELGRKLGFERVAYYAHEYGLGELAGYDIPGEQLGNYPEEAISEKLGGVGKMCSFGKGVSMTPLQLGAMVSAIANGGSLYYLQHPTTPEEIATFQPRLKRQLDIAPLIPEISDGMAGAVQYGTARSLRLNFNEEEILGKTGTCSHAGTHFGWFASYPSVGRVVVVVFLQGGRPTFGSKAAEIAGRMYRKMYDHNFFVAVYGAPGHQATVNTVSTTP